MATAEELRAAANAAGADFFKTNVLGGISGYTPSAAEQPLVSAYGQYAGDLGSQGFFVNPLDPTIANSAYGSSGLLGAAGVEQVRAAEAARQGVPYTPIMGAGAQTGFQQAQAAGLTPQQMVSVGQEFSGAGRVNTTPDQGIRVTDLKGNVIFSGTGPEALKQAAELTSGFGLNKGWTLQSSNAAGDQWTTRYVNEPLDTGLGSFLQQAAPMVLAALAAPALGPLIQAPAAGGAAGAAGGALFAGAATPLGLAAGSAIGSGLGTAIGGGSPMDILKAAAMSGASSYALNSLASQLGLSPSTTATGQPGEPINLLEGTPYAGSVGGLPPGGGGQTVYDMVNYAPFEPVTPPAGLLDVNLPSFGALPSGGISSYDGNQITVTGGSTTPNIGTTLGALGLTLGGVGTLGALAGGGAGTSATAAPSTTPTATPTATPTTTPGTVGYDPNVGWTVTAGGQTVPASGLTLAELTAIGIPSAIAASMIAQAPVQPVTTTPTDFANLAPSLGGAMSTLDWIRAALLGGGLLSDALGGGGGGGGTLPSYAGTIGTMPNLGRGEFQPYTGDYETYGTRAEHQFFKPLLS